MHHTTAPASVKESAPPCTALIAFNVWRLRLLGNLDLYYNAVRQFAVAHVHVGSISRWGDGCGMATGISHEHGQRCDRLQSRYSSVVRLTPGQ